MKKVKLIWEFFGEDAKETAKHHATHLNEFCSKEKFSFFESGTEETTSMSIAFLTVEENNMIAVRNALRPKRGEWVVD
mgnify:CR=1 FL=1